jgi:hypothetical protein
MITNIGLHFPVSSPPRLQSADAIATCTFIPTSPAPAAVLSVGTLEYEVIGVPVVPGTYKPWTQGDSLACPSRSVAVKIARVISQDDQITKAYVAADDSVQTLVGTGVNGEVQTKFAYTLRDWLEAVGFLI